MTESVKDENEKDIFEVISSNLTEINTIIKNYKGLGDINRKFTKVYPDFFKDLKIIKVFYELRTLIDSSDSETQEWKSIFQNTILDNNLNSLELKIFSQPSAKKITEQDIIDDTSNLATTISDLNSAVLDDFKNKNYIENYRRILENRLEIDSRIFEKQDKISEEDKRYIEETSKKIAEFLNGIIEDSEVEEDENIFKDFKTFKESIINFLKKVNDYYIKRKEINEDIDDPYLRTLLEKEYISIADVNFDDLEELITTLQDNFPELRNILKLSIKLDTDSD